MSAAGIVNLLRAEPARRLRSNGLTLLGLVLIALLLALSVAAPVLPLADPYATDLAQRMLPAGSGGHILGTDQLGRDLLSRLIWGTRTSLAVGLFAVLIAALIGTLVGLTAGYFRGWLDSILMRGVDVLLAFPYLLLALAIVAALGPGLRNAMIAIAAVNIPFFARTVRATVVGLAERAFVDAARLTGAGHGEILMRELLPNVLPVVVIMMSTNLGWMILETAGLSFLGLGAQPPTADLGSMLGTGREFLTTVPRVAVLPGIVILILVVGINLVGDGLRDLLDPRLKGEAGTRRARQRSAPSAPVPQRQPNDLLRVEGLSTQFLHDGKCPAVQDLSFSLGPGERLAVVGESGSGKTVTALSLLGLVPAPGRITDGQILFSGEDLIRVSEHRYREIRGNRMAYIPQDPMSALNPVLTVGDQLVETLRAHQEIKARAARAMAVELLERVHIPEPSERMQAYPHELSGGLRQRVVIAMALANDPDLLIADEATTALDATVQAEILKLLNSLCAEQGAALLFISHNLGVVAQLCDRALVMYAGRVVEEASVETLLSRPAHPYTRALIACSPRLGRPDGSLSPIAGQPPPMNELPAGCHFAPRCDYAQAECLEQTPELRPFRDVDRVRCIKAEELDPWDA